MERFWHQPQNPGRCSVDTCKSFRGFCRIRQTTKWQLLLFNDNFMEMNSPIQYSIICPFLSCSDRKSMILFAILRAAVSDPEKNVSSIPADLGPRERKQLEFYNTRYSVCEQVWSWKTMQLRKDCRFLSYDCIFVEVQCTVVRLLLLWHVFSIWSCQRNGNNKILEFRLVGKTAVEIF